MSEAFSINEDMDQETLERVIKMVHLFTGITISEQKKTMLQSRLRRRMRELKIAHYSDYMDFLDKTAGEKQGFIDVMTTNETFFFRTPRIWEYFQKIYLPEWASKNPKSTLKIWSAASSSGEEAYSIAISCQELQDRHAGFEYWVEGSDISSEVLKEAKAGEYFERSVEFMKRSQMELFEKYFQTKAEGMYEISSKLKQKVKFQPHNLFGIKKEQYDIIFLRNVLIYFSSEDQEKVLRNISRSLKEGGILIIGESESLNRLDTPFEFKSACIYTLAKKKDK